jgi:hypothetical protein
VPLPHGHYLTVARSRASTSGARRSTDQAGLDPALLSLEEKRSAASEHEPRVALNTAPAPPPTVRRLSARPVESRFWRGNGGVTLGSEASAENSVTQRVPLVDFEVFVPCANAGAGETVDLEGELDVVCDFTCTKTTVSGTFSNSAQEVSGAGSVTRDTYRGREGEGHRQHFTATLAEGTNTFSVEGLFQLIGPDPANNVHVYASYHFTQDATGEYVATINRLRAECK